MKLFTKLFTLMSLLVVSPVFSVAAFDCNQKGIDELEAVIQKIDRAGGQLESVATFARVYEMAKVLATSRTCRAVVERCSPKLVGTAAYAYKPDSWDWQLAGAITAFSLTGDLTTTKVGHKFIDVTVHDGLSRQIEPRLVATYQKTYALSIGDLSSAEKMLACYRSHMK